ncbi:hypothetical protein TCDM_13182 [Trypanosoma cruzi Dm28c]|uniref:Uncharacterized protein n=1 Tax=Trypanosoma cruzi Dm28c TaxID=1416333 RepID=V5CJ01_TRYCR|nr:hypothetical protein TCDM_13182 [Trypanosoma cruzi Dm28c]
MQGDTHRESEGRVCVRAVHGSLPHSHAATTAAAAAHATRSKRGEVVWETAVLPELFRLGPLAATIFFSVVSSFSLTSAVVSSALSISFSFSCLVFSASLWSSSFMAVCRPSKFSFVVAFPESSSSFGTSSLLCASVSAAGVSGCDFAPMVVCSFPASSSFCPSPSL